MQWLLLVIALHGSAAPEADDVQYILPVKDAAECEDLKRIAVARAIKQGWAQLFVCTYIPKPVNQVGERRA